MSIQAPKKKGLNVHQISRKSTFLCHSYLNTSSLHSLGGYLHLYFFFIFILSSPPLCSSKFRWFPAASSSFQTVSRLQQPAVKACTRKSMEGQTVHPPIILHVL
jgi:hypothetical protein